MANISAIQAHFSAIPVDFLADKAYVRKHG
jgi:hypothetical protein